ncbi:MAG TPA: hypothetical protein PK047_13100 [Saprospiraceae bacterium]|nr:hypothetical protein [Saprospiraceae bacterium]HRO09797.1 hypothetical protein [Saprospiraceae bacterium]HRP43051.1 hypothetical protein [Saprospiraceae bacterium]
MKRLILIFISLALFEFLFAQPDYNRNALTTVALNFNENHSGEVFPRFHIMPVPDKFFNNPLAQPVIDLRGIKRPVMAELPELLQYMNDDFIIGKLHEQKVAQQILAQWFNRQKDGSFNVDMLKERGLYNANDNEFISASASKRGTSTLMDMGLSLVNQTYVVVFDYYNIMNMSEYYIKNETPGKDRTSNGYIAKVKTYLYRLDFGENVAADFFNKYWIYTDDKDKAAKIKAFDDATFRWIPVSRQIAEHQSSQSNPDKNTVIKQKSKEELIDDMNKNLMEKILPQMEARTDEMRVKAMVSNVHPISAKIGKKEGLGFDQRYYVYENRMKKDGDVYKKLIAVVKSMKVVDNRKVTEGKSEVSEFYQIYGGKVDNMGMFLEQKNDVGLNVFLGYTFEGMKGLNGRMEFYISKFMGDLIKENKSGKALTSIKLYVEGGYDKRMYYDFLEDGEKQDFVKISVGLSKDFYPSKFFHWGPFLGYGVESSDFGDETLKYENETSFVEVGARLGFNILPKTQLIGSYQFNYLFDGKSTNKTSGESVDLDYGEFYEGRGNPTISAGLRIMF